MTNNNLHSKYDFVFSRWSRKGYAVLASLGRVVKIGHLSIDICRQADLKGSLSSGVEASFEKEGNPEEKEPDENPSLLLDVFIDLLLFMGIYSVVAVGQNESCDSICFLGVFI